MKIRFNITLAGLALAATLGTMALIQPARADETGNTAPTIVAPNAPQQDGGAGGAPGRGGGQARAGGQAGGGGQQGGMGGPGGGMMGGGNAVMVVDGDFLYILRGNDLYKVNTSDLKLRAQGALPAPAGRQGGGPGGQGGPPGQGGPGAGPQNNK